MKNAMDLSILDKNFYVFTYYIIRLFKNILFIRSMRPMSIREPLPHREGGTRGMHHLSSCVPFDTAERAPP